MTVIKINAITVPADSGDELARRFAGRAGAVDGQPGFEGFELLAPTDGRTVWLVVTRWADEASFEAWRTGRDFAAGHGPGSRDTAEGGPASGSSTGEPGTTPAGEAPKRPPVAVSAELWSYRVADI